MAITSISGVSWANLAKVSGIAKASISSIGGAPAGPPPGPTCTTIYLGYADGRRQSPNDACSPPFAPYDYDSASGVIYTAGGCGNPSFIPVAGYYSDGGTIYQVLGGVLIPWGFCAR